MILSTLHARSTPDETRLALEEVFKEAKGVDEPKLFALLIESKERLQQVGLGKDYLSLATRVYKQSLTKLGKSIKKESTEVIVKLNEPQEGTRKLLAEGLIITVEQVLEKFQKGLLITDTTPLEIALASIVTHELREETDLKAWLMLIGAPSTGKTEIVEALAQHPKTYALSEFGKKTLASGLRPEESVDGKDPSLLNKLKDNIITFKDFTTILSGDGDEKNAIFGQLREIFDGSYKKPFANGVVVNWTGDVTFIGGVTGVIDHQFKFIQQLGARFLFVRLKEEDRDLVARMALKKHKHWKTKFHDIVGAFFRSLPYPSLTLTEQEQGIVADLANIVSMGRYTPLKNREGDTTELPEQEMPPRLTQQFATLLKGLAIIHRRLLIVDNDISKVIRVGMDTLPPSRYYILHKLLDEQPHTMNDIIGPSKYVSNMLKPHLDDLVMGGLIEQSNVGVEGGYKLTPDTIRRLASIRPYIQ